VATLGELTASIAHEVSQPLMDVVTNGEAGMRWLLRKPPEFNEVEIALGRVVAEGRGQAIVKRIRAFLKKPPSHRDELALSTLLEHAAALVNQRGAHMQFITAAKTEINDVEIIVRDTGPGIPHEHLKRLFEPFFTTKPDGMGNGPCNMQDKGSRRMVGE
jgi:C4-dicarboxylate-specific signal transduction histidine kinase